MWLKNAPFCTEKFKIFLRPAARTMRATRSIFRTMHLLGESYAPAIIGTSYKPYNDQSSHYCWLSIGVFL